MLDLGAGSNVAIYRSDEFTQVVRWPPTDQRVNVPLPPTSPTRRALAGDNKTATIQIKSNADGIVRIYSYEKLEKFPFFVSVGVSRAQELANWQTRSLAVGLSGLLLLGLLGGLQYRLWRAESIVRKNEKRLVQSEFELQQLNAELETCVTQRTSELTAANEELDSFSYTIAHDLRAPVRAISGFSEMVLRDNEGKLDAASIGHLKRVVAGSNRMGELIDDLLNLARLSRHAMQRRDFNLSEIAAIVVASLKAAHPERTVEVAIDPGLHANGDPGLMRAVLDNLIGNAWKFTSKVEAANITVGSTQQDGQTVYVVRDNGAGFDMQYAHKLFGVFQRLHHASEFAGTGIGLATVKKILVRHGGKVWVESVPGVGTTVFFTL